MPDPVTMTSSSSFQKLPYVIRLQDESMKRITSELSEIARIRELVEKFTGYTAEARLCLVDAVSSGADLIKAGKRLSENSDFLAEKKDELKRLEESHANLNIAHYKKMNGLELFYNEFMRGSLAGERLALARFLFGTLDLPSVGFMIYDHVFEPVQQVMPGDVVAVHYKAYSGRSATTSMYYKGLVIAKASIDEVRETRGALTDVIVGSELSTGVDEWFWVAFSNRGLESDVAVYHPKALHVWSDEIEAKLRRGY